MLNGRCRFHGGKSLKGIASPAWKDGRHSKYLPTGLRDKYHAAYNDPEMLSLQSEIALIQARLFVLIERVEKGESSHFMDSIKGMAALFEKARRDGRDLDAAAHLQDLIRLVNQGNAEWMNWQDIFAATEQVRRLTESERKRRVEMQLLLSVEDQEALTQYLIAAVRKHVKDTKVLDAIGEELIRLYDQGSSHRLLAG